MTYFCISAHYLRTLHGSLTSAQLATMLRPRFDASWKLRHVRAEIQLVDPGALGIAGAVLRKLKGSDAVSPELETELIQGLAAEARAGME